MNKKEFDINRQTLINAFYSVIDSVELDKTLSTNRRFIIRDNISKVISSMETNKDYWLNYAIKENNVKFSYCKDLSKGFMLKGNRVNIKLGRFFSKHFNFEDFAIDYIVKNILALLMPNQEFAKMIELIVGDDIGKHYYNTRIKTCMTGSEHNFKLEMYIKNPEKVSLLTINGYDCRAFVWTTDCGDKVLDRIYPSGHCLIPTIRKWAKDNGYILRESADQYVRCYDNIKLDNGKYYKITLNPVKRYPFVDTFCFANNEDDKLIVSNEYSFGNIALQNQHGLYIEFFICCNCDKKMVLGENVEFVLNDGSRKQYCRNCYSTLITVCNCCSMKVLRTEAAKPSPKSHLVCFSCLENYYETCSDCNNMFMKNRIKTIKDEKLCSTCYSKKYTFCRYCGKEDLVLDADDVKMSCGDYFCNKCFKSLKNCGHCGEHIFDNKCKEIEDKVYCSYCARYKIKSKKNNSFVKNNIDYISHEDYKEIVDYISTNISDY